MSSIEPNSLGNWKEISDVLINIADKVEESKSKGQNIEIPKIYITRDAENKLTLTTNEGNAGKTEKNLSVIELHDLIRKVVDEAKSSNVFNLSSHQDVDKLNKVIKGIEYLRGRVETARNTPAELFKIKVMDFFGIPDKYAIALNKSELAVNILKIQTLKSRNSELTKENEVIDVSIKNAKKTLEGACNPTTLTLQKKTAAEFKKETSDSISLIKEDIDKCQMKLEKLNPSNAVKNKDTLSDELDAITIDGEDDDELDPDLEELKTPETDPLVGPNSNQKSKSSGTIFGIFSSGISSFTNVVRPKKDAAYYQSKLKSLTAQRKNKNGLLDNINIIENEIAALENRKNTNLQSIKVNNNEIKRLEAKIAIKESTVESNLNIKKKPVNLKSSLNMKGCNRLDLQALTEIQAKIDPSPKGDTKAYVGYLRLTSFGFGVGQAKSMNVLAVEMNKSGIDVSEGLDKLAPLLEGGQAAVNMCYVSDSLSKQISSSKDPSKVQELKKLQVDINRSLPIAIKAMRINETTSYQKKPSSARGEINQLTQIVQDRLTQMKTGEKLYIPTESEGHQTLLVLEKMDGGKVKPTFYNTGEGVQANLSGEVSWDALRAVTTNKMPTSMIYEPINFTGENFQGMMTQIFTVPLRKGNGVEVINQALKSTLGEGCQGAFREVQKNGVCSYMILDQAFEDSLGPTNFKQYKDGLLIQIKDDLREVVTEMKKNESYTNSFESALDGALLDLPNN